MNTRPRAPGWAAAADLLALALLALAAVVAITGGFRGRPWGIAVSITSAGRIALWAAAVLVIRHLAVPHPSALALAFAGAKACPKTAAAIATGGALLLLAALSANPSRGHETRRELLLAELQPSWLGNCTFKRYGEARDGGYLLCANLLESVEAGYSYGINGYDGWGCDVSRELGVVVHQYDCFNTTVPACAGGKTVFHAECVGEQPAVDDDDRRFDTLLNQMARNGDGGRQVVLKMDVEGAEWRSFLFAPDAVWQRVDQIAVEFHGVDDPRSLAVVRRLKEFFHVAHLHFNNYSCAPGLEPFPASAYEVLFVSRRLARVDPLRSQLSRLGLIGPPSSPLAVPNDWRRADCQEARPVPPV